MAAARYARARRGQLRLSQQALADRASVSRRTIIDFEAERTWPNTDTLVRLERMGLDLLPGYLTEYAATHGRADQNTLDEDIAAILDSNLHPDLKLRLIDRLRSIEPPAEEVTGGDDIVRDLSPGEEQEGRDTA